VITVCVEVVARIKYAKKHWIVWVKNFLIYLILIVFVSDKHLIYLILIVFVSAKHLIYLILIVFVSAKQSIFNIHSLCEC
jgi:hypothetical protein